MKLLFALFFAAILTSPFISLAQPGSDIFLIELEDRNEEQWQLGKPKNITNYKGYDNQPYFSPDQRWIYFASIRTKNQSDIYRYQLSSGKTEQITYSRESDFSPRLTPDGRHISTVVVEKDSTQRIWKTELPGQTYFDPEQGDAPASFAPGPIHRHLNRVGYYHWTSRETLVVFRLPEPFTLESWNITSGKNEIITDSVGRCIRAGEGPGNPVLFVRKGKNSSQLMKFFPGKKDLETVVEFPEGLEDYCLTPWGSILTVRKGELLEYGEDTNGEWLSRGMAFKKEEETTRIEISPDGRFLAIVASEAKE